MDVSTTILDASDVDVMSSPRISSRLALKRTADGSRLPNNRSDEFEYTPVSSRKCIKDINETKPDVITKVGAYLTSQKKKSGKDKPHEILKSLPSHNELYRKGGKAIKLDDTIKHVVQKTQIDGQPSQSADDIMTKLTKNAEPVGLLHGPTLSMMSILQSQLEKPTLPSDVHSELENKIFPLVVGLFSSSILSVIPGAVDATLNSVARETGIKWDYHKKDISFIWGSLSDMVSASKLLAKHIKEADNQSQGAEEVRTGDASEIKQEVTPSKTADNPCHEVLIDSPLLIDTPSCNNQRNPHESLDPPCPEMELIDNNTLVGRSDSTRQSYDERFELDAVEAQDNISDVTDINISNEQISQDDTLDEINADTTIASVLQPPSANSIIKSLLTSSKNRDRRSLRRQKICQHGVESCSLCQYKCELCEYRSSAVAVRKHVQRVHPSVIYPCEVCGMQFGIRYDMRRHRLIHFDKLGNLTNKGLATYKEFKKSDNVKAEPITLADLELNFDSAREKGSAMNTGSGDMLENSPGKSSKALRFDTPVLCGFCQFEGTLDQIENHHKSSHRQVDNDHMMYVCHGCDEIYPLEDLKTHHGECETPCKPKIDFDSAVLTACCKLCRAQGTKSQISHHIEVHPISIICSVCQYKTSVIQNMSSHILAEHTKGQSREQKGHLRNPPKETSIYYKCGICGRIFKNRSSLQGHFKTHDPKDALKCDICSFTTKKNGLLNYHKKQEHAPEVDRICGICGKLFSRSRALAFHKESVHGVGAQLHKCLVCEKVFTAKRFLSTHFKRVHKQTQRYTCPDCGKGFYERGRMIEHQRVHLPENEKDQFKIHACTICDRKYTNKVTLIQHMNTHKGLKPYKCEICPKEFSMSVHLHKHLRAHSSSRPYVCVHCDKAFKFRYKLTAHMITHTREGKHVCTQCGKVYTARHSLKKHVCKARFFNSLSRENNVNTDPTQQANGPPTSIQSVVQVTGVEGSGFVVQPTDSVATGENILQIFEGSLEGAQVVEISRVPPTSNDVIPNDVITIANTCTSTFQDIVGNIQVEQIAESGTLCLQTSSGVIAEPAPCSVMYMCSICNALFGDQVDVNSHMAIVHGAEAVISHEPTGENPQALITGNQLVDHTMNVGEVLVKREEDNQGTDGDIEQMDDLCAPLTVIVQQEKQ